MRKTICCLSILALMMMLAPLALVSAADEVPVPNINKRGDDEKKFVGKVATTIVTQARTSIKHLDADEKLTYEKKEPKAGRTEIHIKAPFKGVATKKKYTATITVVVDTADKDKWEVLRIDYKDDVKGVVPFNRKNVEALVAKLNAK